MPNANWSLAAAAQGEPKGITNCHEAVVTWFEKAGLVHFKDAASKLRNVLNRQEELKRLLVPPSESPLGKNALSELEPGTVVGFYGEDGSGHPVYYGHSMVVCARGTLAGVNNTQVVGEAAVAKCQTDRCRPVGYCGIGVSNLDWKEGSEKIGPNRYVAYAEDAGTIADRINAKLDEINGASGPGRRGSVLNPHTGTEAALCYASILKPRSP